MGESEFRMLEQKALRGSKEDLISLLVYVFRTQTGYDSQAFGKLTADDFVRAFRALDVDFQYALDSDDEEVLTAATRIWVQAGLKPEIPWFIEENLSELRSDSPALKLLPPIQVRLMAFIERVSASGSHGVASYCCLNMNREVQASRSCTPVSMTLQELADFYDKWNFSEGEPLDDWKFREMADYDQWLCHREFENHVTSDNQDLSTFSQSLVNLVNQENAAWEDPVWDDEEPLSDEELEAQGYGWNVTVGLLVVGPWGSHRTSRAIASILGDR